jgi:hypothetical protein
MSKTEQSTGKKREGYIQKGTKPAAVELVDSCIVKAMASLSDCVHVGSELQVSNDLQ